MAHYLDEHLQKMICKDLRSLIKETLPNLKKVDKTKKQDLIEIILENEDQFLEKLGIVTNENKKEEVKPVVKDTKPAFYSTHPMKFIIGSKRRAEYIFELPPTLRHIKLKNAHPIVKYFYERLVEQSP